jgi:hypothetical protein
MFDKTILAILPEHLQKLFQNSIVNALFKTQAVIEQRVESKLISSDAYDMAKDEEYTVSDIIKNVGLSDVKSAADISNENELKNISEMVLDEIQKLLTIRKEIEEMNQMERMEDLISRNVFTLFNIELEKDLSSFIYLFSDKND